MSWLIIVWFTFFISFLLLFSSTTSSGFRPIFTIHNMEKCEHTVEKWICEGLKAKDFLFEIKIVSYSLVNYFLVLGIRLQTGRVCLCIWNISFLLLRYFFPENHNSLSAYRVRGPAINQLYISWTFWVEGNFNIINQRGKPQKKGGGGGKPWRKLCRLGLQL